MTREKMHIGNAAAFAFDRTDAGGPVADSLIASGKPAALFYETLAERTLAFAQRERRSDPEKGYSPDIAGFVGPVLRRCIESAVPIIGNFGAANPMGAARRLHTLAKEQGIAGLRVAVVEGDDLEKTSAVYRLNNGAKRNLSTWQIRNSWRPTFIWDRSRLQTRSTKTRTLLSPAG